MPPLGWRKNKQQHESLPLADIESLSSLACSDPAEFERRCIVKPSNSDAAPARRTGQQRRGSARGTLSNRGQSPGRGRRARAASPAAANGIRQAMPLGARGGAAENSIQPRDGNAQNSSAADTSLDKFHENCVALLGFCFAFDILCPDVYGIVAIAAACLFVAAVHGKVARTAEASEKMSGFYGWFSKKVACHVGMYALAALIQRLLSGMISTPFDARNLCMHVFSAQNCKLALELSFVWVNRVLKSAVHNFTGKGDGDARGEAADAGEGTEAQDKDECYRKTREAFLWGGVNSPALQDVAYYAGNMLCNEWTQGPEMKQMAVRYVLTAVVHMATAFHVGLMVLEAASSVNAFLAATVPYFGTLVLLFKYFPGNGNVAMARMTNRLVSVTAYVFLAYWLCVAFNDVVIFSCPAEDGERVNLHQAGTVGCAAAKTIDYSVSCILLNSAIYCMLKEMFPSSHEWTPLHAMPRKVWHLLPWFPAQSINAWDWLVCTAAVGVFPGCRIKVLWWLSACMDSRTNGPTGMAPTPRRDEASKRFSRIQFLCRVVKGVATVVARSTYGVVIGALALSGWFD